MQSHITFSTFSLKIEIIFVISAFLTCLLTGGCGKKEQTVFTETVYASGNVAVCMATNIVPTAPPVTARGLNAALTIVTIAPGRAVIFEMIRIRTVTT